MATQSSVLTGLGAGPFVYRQIKNSLGILVGPRTYPRIVTPGLRGYYLGLHDEIWAQQKARPTGAATYFVQVIPIYGDLVDPDGDPLKGTPTTENTTKGVTFDFNPFSMDWACTGYEVWAGTVSGTLYKQGELTGRWNTHFVIGTTWTYNGSGDVIDAQTIGPPAFADALEVYQLEGAVDARIFMGGGKKYLDGYAQISKTDTAPVLTGGTGAEDDYTVWEAITDGSFRMRLRWKEDTADHDEWFDIDDVDFTGDASMANVASTLQVALRAQRGARLIGGTDVETTVANWTGITDGSLEIWFGGTQYQVTGLDFSGDASMSDIASTISTGLSAANVALTCTWDATAGRLYVEHSVSNRVTNGAFASDTGWTKGSGWTIAAGVANMSRSLTNMVSNGQFTSDTVWTKEANWTIAGGKATWTDPGSGVVTELHQDITLVDGTKYYIKFDYDFTANGGTGTLVLKYGSSVDTTGNSFFSWGSISIDISANTSGTIIAEVEGQASRPVLTFQVNNGAGTEASQTLDIDDVSVAAKSESQLTQEIGDMKGRDVTISYDVANLGYAEAVRVGVSDGAGNYVWGTARGSDGTYEETITVTSDYDYDTIVFEDYSSGNNDYDIDNVSLTVDVLDTDYLSYCYRHSSGTGTDVSSQMGCRETSTGVFLNRRGKMATTETFAWSTDHFVITGSDTGDQYDISFFEVCKANVGTDISVATLLDCRVNSTSASLTRGQTALRTILGNGTAWGKWCLGMQFRFTDEGKEYIIDRAWDETKLHIDSAYAGDNFATDTQYVLRPYDDQYYRSELGNPFYFSTDGITKVPTDDGDGITAIRRSAGSVAIFMDHHVWTTDAIALTAPGMISSHYGCEHTNACVPYAGGVAVFGKTDIFMVSGRHIKSLDNEDRVKKILGRKSANTIYPHGVFLNSKETDLIIWYVGLDSSTTYNVALVYQPKTGNYWLYNVKDAQCSGIIRDANGDGYLVTGSKYDTAHSIPAFTFIHGTGYKNDGASADSTKTKQGVINSLGSATETAGYLTCAALNSALAVFQAVSAGYFSITIDGTEYNVGPCDFSSGHSDFNDVAATIQTAIRAQTGGSETCVYSTDHFVITSGTTTNQSNVSFLRPYIPSGGTDISGLTYCNGRSDRAAETGAVSQLPINLYKMDGATNAALYTTNDAEKGVYVFICDTNFENGQYVKVVSNSATQITVTPNPSTAPVAGWYWFLGGIVPKFTKWFDFGSPQHKHKVHGISFTVDPGEATAGNRIALHGMQDLSDTVRTKKVQVLGGSEDTVNTLNLGDKESTQQGITFLRPNSVQGFKLEDIEIIHRPRR